MDWDEDGQDLNDIGNRYPATSYNVYRDDEPSDPDSNNGNNDNNGPGGCGGLLTGHDGQGHTDYHDEEDLYDLGDMDDDAPNCLSDCPGIDDLMALEDDGSLTGDAICNYLLDTLDFSDEDNCATACEGNEYVEISTALFICGECTEDVAGSCDQYFGINEIDKLFIF